MGTLEFARPRHTERGRCRAGPTSRASRRDSRQKTASGKPNPADADQGPAAPPRRVGWLVACGGLGGWALVVMLGRLNPFEGDLFFRWMILGASWVAAVFLVRLSGAGYRFR